MILSVASDGTGDFCTIQAAVDAALEGGCAPVIIRVRPGIYNEKLYITKDNLRIVGDDAAQTVLTHSDHALQRLPDGNEAGTFLSYTMMITGRDVTIENLTIRNDAGDGRAVGQAVALYAAGDRGVFRRCIMAAHQDTLFCGPVMPKVAQHALPHRLPVTCESVGDAPLTSARQYFEECFIQGDVDFIFGPNRCWFERCTLLCNNRGMEINGYYTAANTPEGQAHGFVFHDCRLMGEGCAAGSVYLGRPWRTFARTVFLDCEMDACVHPAGWADWGEKPVTWRYAEHGTRGERADLTLRHPGAARLSDAEAGALTLAMVLGGADNWKPDQSPRALFIAGDSTACDYPESRYPRAGWGQALPPLLPGMPIYNEAASGRSSMSFVNERRLSDIVPCLRPGDLFLIQFGHNDEKDDPARGTEARSSFLQYLSMYIDAAQSRGAVPVLLTSIVRRHFVDGALTDTHGDYPDTVRALAKERGVMLIDLEQMTCEAVAALGEAGSKAWFLHLGAGHRNYPEGAADDSHLRYEGARAVAGMVAKELLYDIKHHIL
ncbi:MAG: GDSL-type esterase/lipase family protein [Oscillospiraceae bacterium]|jgi:pectinesterase|nr:GDSL-type esterase/lipase family protein [Oscillospiraceae bacterium]